MPKEKIIGNSARIAGVLLLLSAIPHATLGTAEILQHIKFGDIRNPAIPIARNFLVFSGVMLLLSGIWVLFLVRDLRKLDRRAWWQAVFIGLGYTGGAAAAMAWNGVQIHLLAFALMGLMLLVPALVWAGSFSSRNIKNH